MADIEQLSCCCDLQWNLQAQIAANEMIGRSAGLCLAASGYRRVWQTAHRIAARLSASTDARRTLLKASRDAADRWARQPPQAEAGHKLASLRRPEAAIVGYEHSCTRQHA